AMALASKRDIALIELEPPRLPLMRFFTRRTGSASEAKDLTQDTFNRLLAASATLETDDPKGFVFRTALNLLRDRSRKAAIRNNASIDAIDTPRICPATMEFVAD